MIGSELVIFNVNSTIAALCFGSFVATLTRRCGNIRNEITIHSKRGTEVPCRMVSVKTTMKNGRDSKKKRSESHSELFNYLHTQRELDY